MLFREDNRIVSPLRGSTRFLPLPRAHALPGVPNARGFRVLGWTRLPSRRAYRR